MSRLAGVVALVLLQSGCIATYREFPDTEQLDAPRQRAAVDREYTFGIADGSAAGGYNGLYEALRTRSPYRYAEPAEQIPKKGLHVAVRIDSLPPSPMSIIAGYLSVSTLTLLPAWSTQDGYLVFFDVYRDGKRIDSYDYRVRRSIFLWLGLLPFSWINFLTPSEHEAFEAMALQFFQDARRHFGTAT